MTATTKILRRGCAAGGLALLACAAATAELVEIQGLDTGGQLSWTQPETNSVTRVQWASDLAGPWESGWSTLQNLPATNPVMTRAIPRFFRILASTNVISGTDLAGWEVELGDGVYAPDGVAPVTAGDIATVHAGTHSELIINTSQRRIMAHNITFRRLFDDEALAAVHLCGFEFRLPYLPSTTNTVDNAQTIEGGLFVWDGTQTRLDYGGAFQWSLNPWSDTFGDLMCWSGHVTNEWVSVGTLPPDTNWHRVRMEIDYRTRRSLLAIDSNQFLFAFTATPRPTWDSNTAARFQVEAISAFPGETGFVHRVEIRNWHWSWQP